MSKIGSNGKYMDYSDCLYSVVNFTKILKYSLMLLGVVVILDIRNCPSLVVHEFGAIESVFFTSILLIIVSLIILENKYFDFRNYVEINVIDFIMQIIMLFSFMYTLTLLLFNDINYYKLFIILVVCIIDGGVILYREKKYNRILENAKTYETNMIDLKDLYENKIPSYKSKIWLDEREVDYDLLGRTSIINYIVDVLLNCNPLGRFVISLEGPWGCGKTTILKNVKRMINDINENIIIIDDFEPWVFGSEEAIVENFFKQLLNIDGNKINSIEFKKSIMNLTNIIVDYSNTSGILKSMIFNNSSIKENKDIINEHLRLCGKNVVFFIDNLDRLDNKNIMLIFKLVGSILDFQRVSYIISFDPNKVEKIFEDKLNMDYNYLKKIIQMQIKVPVIDNQTKKEVAKKCMKNLAEHYIGADIKESDYNDVMELIAEKLDDFRELKRYINSGLIYNLLSDVNLSIKDKLIIDFIRLRNYGLYESIYKNKNYYISEDRIYDRELMMSTIGVDKFNSDCTAYFEGLFSKKSNSAYTEMLSIIFPYVKRYTGNLEFQSKTGVGNKEEHDQIEKSRGVASAKYFDLYFIEKENEFSLISQYIESFIYEVNNGDRTKIESEIATLLNDTDIIYQREFFSNIRLYINNLSKDSLYFVVSGIYENILKVENHSAFLSLNSLQICTSIISELLYNLDEAEFINFTGKIKCELSKLYINSEITYWMDRPEVTNYSQERYETWKAIQESIVKDIINQKIDLYSDKYYSFRNIWGVYRCLKDDLSSLRKYISGVVTGENIFKFLYDLVGYSSSREGYSYHIDKKNVDNFIGEDMLYSLMSDINPETGDENILMSIYCDFVDKPNVDPISRGVSFKNELFLNL